MRGLITTDAFKAMRLIKACGLTEEARRIADAMQEGKMLSVSELGKDLIFSVIENASEPRCEAMLYDFLSGLFECDKSDVANTDPIDNIEKFESLKDLIPVERWKTFFIKVSRLMK